jgi:hypothetical protein
VAEVFTKYMEADGSKVTRAMFEQNLARKRDDPTFTADLAPLLAAGQTWDPSAALDRVSEALVSRLEGEPWKGG